MSAESVAGGAVRRRRTAISPPNPALPPGGGGDKERLRRVFTVTYPLPPVVWVLALLLLGAAPGAGAQPLGRLFTTPAERAQLDTLRASRPQRQEAAEPESSAGAPQTGLDLPPPPPPAPFTMNGLVVRSEGPNTAWVDGRPVLRAEDSEEGMRVNTRDAGPDGAAVTVLQGGQAVRLKPGQTYLPDQGEVSDRRAAAPKEKGSN